MGQWAIVITGHGIHDNGRPDDADQIAARFLAELAKSQDEVRCTFTVGASREIQAAAAAVSADA